MDGGSVFSLASSGRRMTPEPVWAAARRDYLAGLSGPEVCARYGLRLGTFKQHAATGKWRRKDQPAPELPDEPFDEGHALEARVEGDLNRLDYAQLAHVANCRMMRAVLRGGAIEALRWRRVEAVMDAKQEEVDQRIEDTGPASQPAPAPTDRTDRTDSSDQIIADDGAGPPIAFQWNGPENSAPPDWLARREPSSDGGDEA